MASPCVQHLEWNQVNYPVMQAIADAAVVPYRGLVHPELLFEIEWLAADGRMMTEELHPQLAAGWVWRSSRSLNRRSATAWTGRRSRLRASSAPRHRLRSRQLVKQVMAKGYKYFAWPFEAADASAPEDARARILVNCDGLVVAMLARTVQLRIPSAVGPVLRQAMGHLSTAERALLRLRFRENLPMEEIGVRLGCMPKEARRRCQRMLEELGAHGRLLPEAHPALS
jgi:DNA-directed RNA polymerase specialized sigma24 family protein